MPAKKKASNKITVIVREELDAEDKVAAPLTADDSALLAKELERAFKISEQKSTGVLVVVVLDDETYLAESDSNDIYALIVTNSGEIIHSFGNSVVIKTASGNYVTMILMGRANAVAAAGQFMAMKEKADLRKMTASVAAKKGKIPAPVSAPDTVRRSNRNKGKGKALATVDPTPVPSFAPTSVKRGKGGAISHVDITSPTDVALTSICDLTEETPEDKKTVTIEDSDSDSDGSYTEYNDMGLTQECYLDKLKAVVNKETDDFLKESRKERLERKKMKEEEQEEYGLGSLF